MLARRISRKIRSSAHISLLLSSLGLLAGVVSCQSDPTPKGELVLAFQTDMQVPKDLDAVTIQVTMDGKRVFSKDYAVGPNGVKLPATLAIQQGSDPSAPVRVRVIGWMNGKAKVLRETLSTVPSDRAALLRMPITWLCWDSAKQEGFQDNGQPNIISTCPTDQACKAGICQSITVESKDLPDFVGKDVFGGSDGPGQGGACFDTVACFSQGWSVPLNMNTCTFARPDGVDNLSVAIVRKPGTRGICGKDACLIPLNANSEEGWTENGDGVVHLPPAVCGRIVVESDTLGVAVTGACTPKTENVPTCGPWSNTDGSPGSFDGDGPDASAFEGDGGVDAATEGGVDAAPDVDGGQQDSSLDGSPDATDAMTDADLDGGLDATDAMTDADLDSSPDATDAMTDATADSGDASTVCSQGDGLYCGKQINQSPDSLFNCTNGSISLLEACALGCDPGTAANAKCHQVVADIVAGGNYYTCAVISDGSLWCWGDSIHGEVGVPGNNSFNTPQQLFSSGVDRVYAGDTHTCATFTDGKLKCWGNNSNGQVGNGASGSDITSPADVKLTGTMTSGIATMSLSRNNTCAIDNLGALWCWGNNNHGQLAQPANQPGQSTIPVQVMFPQGGTAIEVGVGDDFVCAVTANPNATYCWGYGQYGRLGDGSTSSHDVPVPVSSQETFTQISLGGTHACGLTINNEVFCWGNNLVGQVGDNTQTSWKVPTKVPGVKGVSSVSCGGTFSCAVATTGTAMCWGNEMGAGNLGNGHTGNSKVPPDAVLNLSQASYVAAGNTHACAMRQDNKVMCWGYNGFRQLGDGTNSNSATPVLFTVLPN